MPNVLHYWMLEPLRGGITDDGSRKPAFETRVTDPAGRSVDAAVFCDEHGEPWFLRVRLVGVEEQTMHETFGHLLLMAKEHLITTLRLCWHPQARILPLSIWTAESRPGVGASIRLQMPRSFGFDPVHAQAAFEHTLEARQSFRLMMDGACEGIPLAYRFLSLFKFLEIRFLDQHARWDREGLRRALAPFQERYAALQLPRPFFEELCALRDRCAHIRSGRESRRVLGVTELHFQAAAAVEKVLPLLVDVCREQFNLEHEGKLRIADLVPWYQKIFESSESAKDVPTGGPAEPVQ